MKLDFKFSNLCGTVYRKGNVVFTGDGNSILSPVGNRVTQFDLKNNRSSTLPFENCKNITKLCISPNNGLLLAIDEENKSVLFSLTTNAKLKHFTFKKKVYDIKFSPDGKFIAVTFGRCLQIWCSPTTKKEFQPFILYRTLPAGYGDVTCLDWSHDSQFLISGGQAMTAQVHSLHPMINFKPYSLSGHRNKIVNCFFEHDSLNAYTISKDGSLFYWTCDTDIKDFKKRENKRKLDEDESQTLNEQTDEADVEKAKWFLEQKHFFKQDQTDVTRAEYHKRSKVLVVGFSTGIFMLYEMPSFIMMHSLSITQHKISSIAINNTGDWLAFASSTLGQLLVWEWRSETYILKQQGTFHDMTVLKYSPNGNFIATGGEDGKVKLWNSTSGFSFVTFTKHTAGITGIEFSQNGQVVVSASLDGTVRAWDMNRYRNFRTFASPHPCQFSCMALDDSGEIICAGSIDTFEIFMWSMQNGRLLEVLVGHTGPVTSLAFNPRKALLVSGSWDKSVKVWDVFSSTTAKETFEVGTDVTSVAFRPDGYEVAITSIDGNITFWQPDVNIQVGSVEGRKDISAGRRANDMITAKNSQGRNYFTSICYSADGTSVLAGGNSKYVCIYHVEQQVLLRRFPISMNRSLDGMNQMLNSKNMTEAGPLDLIDVGSGDDSDSEMRSNIQLPGVLKADMSSRKVQPRIQTKALCFSPTGRCWAAATTEGLLIFSLDTSLTFRPEDLDMDITPHKISELISQNQNSKALIYSFRLNEDKIISKVIENIPCTNVSSIASSIPEMYLEKLLTHIAKQLETSAFLEYYLTWTKSLMLHHGKYLKANSSQIAPTLRSLQKNLIRHSSLMSALCDSNSYSLEYMLSIKPNPVVLGTEDVSDDGKDDEDEMDESPNDEIDDDYLDE